MLKNRLVEVEIPESSPFRNDKLNRQKCASTFIDLFSMYADSGCVISLNGEWGSGKTTFVKMTMQEMINNGFHPLYFNAWENDFVIDPLVALLSEIKEIAPSSEKWNIVVANAGKIISSIGSTAIKGYLNRNLGFDVDAISAGIDEATSIFKDSMDDFANQKKTLQNFKDSLKKYVAENTDTGKPIVFFIDELDRCNPHFAVKILERIKHLFDIPNIIFVLSICKEQIEYAIQGYYGSNNIDAVNYLRRFIDIEFTLPKPDSEQFCNYLYEYYNFGHIFSNEKRQQYRDFQYDEESFKRIASSLIDKSKLDLRTIDKIYVHTRLALYTFAENEELVPDVFFFLCFLKITDFSLYNDIENHTYTVQQLLTKLEDFLPNSLLRKDYDYGNIARRMTFCIISLLHMYDMRPNGIEYEKIFVQKEGDSPKLKCEIMESELFNEVYNWECKRGYFRNITLHHLIKRINLQQSFIL